MSGPSSALVHNRSSSNFVEEYSGVVGFYSYLAQSWKDRPPFLRRNLSYQRAAFEQDWRKLNGRSEGVGAAEGEWETGRSHSSRKSVVYRLRYNDGQKECVQKKSDFQCAWCDMSCGNVEGLMCHLPACHDRFAYTLVATNPPEVYVSVRQNCTERVYIQENLSYVSRRKNAHSDMSDLEDAEAPSSEDCADEEEEEEECEYDAGEEEGEVVGMKRSKPTEEGKTKSKEKKKIGQRSNKEKPAGKGFADREYYRSQTCLKIHPEDMDYDSDDDVDDEWQLKRAEELMDEFVDVTNKEKFFMKLWNRFVHKHKILADFQLPEACRVFANHHLEELRSKGLRDELLFHMFALWDFNLLNKDQIMEVIRIVDAADEVEKSKKGASSGSSPTIRRSHEGGAFKRPRDDA